MTGVQTCALPIYRSAHAWGSDDAYITYRYAVNLLQGWGPVFNPGEAVEGYSNPLYLIVVTALMAAVGPEQVYAASVALNALAFAATLPMLGRLAGRVAPDKPMLQAIAPLFGALFPPLWNAAASGLETMPVYALQLGLLTLVLAPPARRGVALAAGVAAALVAIRTDGFVIPLAIAVPLFLAGERILANYPFGPRTGTPLNATVLSYCDDLDLGCNIDPAAVTDPDGFMADLDDSFADLLGTT